MPAEDEGLGGERAARGPLRLHGQSPPQKKGPRGAPLGTEEGGGALPREIDFVGFVPQDSGDG